MSVQLIFSTKNHPNYMHIFTILPLSMWSHSGYNFFSPFLLGSLLKSLLQKSLTKKVRRPKNKGCDLESI